MNKLIITLLLLINNVSFGQDFKVISKQLSEQEIDSLFTVNIKDQLQLDYVIHTAYQYKDKAGKHFIMLSKNLKQCQEQDTCFDAIKVHCFLYNNAVFDLEWKLNDFIIPDSQEYTITHWTKYLKIEDYDNDGLADPIIVYGTKALNDFDDGRLKILVYYKNKKSGVRHQNGILDNERNTQVDKQFYSLPVTIKNQVTVIMKNIVSNGHGIFPHGWQEAMKNNKLKFDEN